MKVTLAEHPLLVGPVRRPCSTLVPAQFEMLSMRHQACSNGLLDRHGTNGSEYSAQEIPHVTIRKGPSQEVWSRYELTIHQLYLNGNKPLKHVVSIMEREHGHKAR